MNMKENLLLIIFMNETLVCQLVRKKINHEKQKKSKSEKVNYELLEQNVEKKHDLDTEKNKLEEFLRIFSIADLKNKDSKVNKFLLASTF